MNLATLFKKYDFELNQLQIEQLNTYCNFLVEYNKNVNLTALTTQSDVYTKHFLDSCLIFKHFSLNHKAILDLGAGAGFPSIPNAILQPNANFVIIEPLQKRCVFLNLLIEKLQLTNVSVLCKRGEDISASETESFDIVCARAVAKGNVLVELLASYAKIGGLVVLPKANLELSEKQDTLNAAKKLKLKFKEIISYEYEGNFRNNMVFEKTFATPKAYPRNFGQIKKSPLK